MFGQRRRERIAFVHVWHKEEDLLVLSASAGRISAEWSQRVKFMLFSTSIIQLRGAKVSSLVSFSSLVEHIKLMFVGVVELS